MIFRRSPGIAAAWIENAHAPIASEGRTCSTPVHFSSNPMREGILSVDIRSRTNSHGELSASRVRTLIYLPLYAHFWLCLLARWKFSKAGDLKVYFRFFPHKRKRILKRFTQLFLLINANFRFIKGFHSEAKTLRISLPFHIFGAKCTRKVVALMSAKPKEKKENHANNKILIFTAAFVVLLTIFALFLTLFSLTCE